MSLLCNCVSYLANGDHADRHEDGEDNDADDDDDDDDDHCDDYAYDYADDRRVCATTELAWF